MQKCVVITGAAGGIGSALADAFIAADYHVIGTDIHKPDSIEKGLSFVHADLQKFTLNESYAENVIQQIKEAFGDRPLSGLINNAAVQIVKSVEELDRISWQSTLDTNLSAPFFLTQGLLPELMKTNGCVLNIGSIHANLTKKNFVAYATSKAALNGLTKALSVELGEFIRVNAIEPAAIETEMLKSGFKNNDEAYAKLERAHPTGQIGKPEDVARLARMIIDLDISFMNGSIIPLDGGVSSRLHDPA